MNIYDIIIIGAGPAGLFSGANSGTDKKICIIEKNDSPGKKLLITGSGQCNISHGGLIDDFLPHYGNKNRFVKPSLFQFTNSDLVQFFEERYLKLVEKENGKIFPKTLRARDVLDTLLNACKEKNVTLLYNDQAKAVTKEDSAFRVMTKSGKNLKANSLVIATGGKSYPTTGSTGDGLHFAETMGHTIIKPEPALTPVKIKNFKFSELAGISLYNREIYLYRDGKKIRKTMGDILFTHLGLSGPGILDFSRYIKSGDAIKISLINYDNNTFRKKIIEDMKAEGKKSIKNYLTAYKIPERLVSLILNNQNISHELKMSQLDRKTRKIVTEEILELPFTIEHPCDFNMAMVTMGGVSTEEINRNTMESRLVKNLYFAGEVIDVDGDTGGYNLQFAFSSGYLAIKSILKK